MISFHGLDCHEAIFMQIERRDFIVSYDQKLTCLQTVIMLISMFSAVALYFSEDEKVALLFAFFRDKNLMQMVMCYGRRNQKCT